jgi:uncharacterized protein (TIGR02300 family)
VARPELGTKRTCPTTGRKFYDLNRDPIISPYTGEEIPRTQLEPQRAMPAARARPVADEEETDVVPAGPEVISLEDVEAGEEAKAGTTDDDVSIDDESGTSDDTFLEDEEEGGDDVADLIDSDIEDEDEV